MKQMWGEWQKFVQRLTIDVIFSSVSTQIATSSIRGKKGSKDINGGGSGEQISRVSIKENFDMTIGVESF